MKKIQKSLYISFAYILMMASSCTSAHMQSSDVIVDKLLETSQSWDGVSYTSYPSGKPELTILKIIVEPHTVLGWHTHQMPNAAYVLSGHLVVETRTGNMKKIIHTGETLAETVGTVHRGYTENEPVTLIVFYAGTKDLPLSKPEK